MITKFKIFENNNKIINNSFNLTLNDVDYIYSDWDIELLDEKEKVELKNYITNFIKNNFSLDKNGKLLGVENFPEKITLYRLIQSDNINKINEKFLGKHWTINKNILYSKNFQDQIGIGFDSEDELFIIEAEFNKNQIDIIQTIINQLSNDIENEITIKKDEKPLKYNIEKYNSKINENYSFSDKFKNFNLSDTELYDIALWGLKDEFRFSGAFDKTEDIKEAAKIIVNEDFKTFLNQNYPEGFKNFPDFPICYRILSLENINNLNKKNLGLSWFANKELNENFFQQLEHLTKVKLKNHKLFLISAKIPISKIDIPRTLWLRSSNFAENEIRLKNDNNIQILNIEEL